MTTTDYWEPGPPPFPVFAPSVPTRLRRRLADTPGLQTTVAPWSRMEMFRAGPSGFLMTASLVGLTGLAVGIVPALFIGTQSARFFPFLLVCVLIPAAVTLHVMTREPTEPRTARRFQGSYICKTDLNVDAQKLLTHAHYAVATVLRSDISRDGLLDRVHNAVALPHELWDIAQILRTQTKLAREQARASSKGTTPELEAVLEPQKEALERSRTAVRARIDRLVEYAQRVEVAERAYRAQRLLESNDEYRELLARTEGAADIQLLDGKAAELEGTLRASLSDAIVAGETLAVPPEATR